MNIEIATASKPSRKKNEDIAGHTGGTFWLMDGATQLVPPDHGLDAAWHVERLDQAFRSLLVKEPDITLEKLARKAIAETGTEFYTRSGLTPGSPQDLRPYCTMILCRPDTSAGALDYLLVCDSTLAVIGAGKETIISDPRIDDDKPLAQFYNLLRQGESFDSSTAKAEMGNVYKHVFNKIGNPDGWFAVGQDAGVIDYALSGTVPLTPQDHVLLMSDGFTRAVDTLSLFDSFQSLDQAIEKQGIENILESIRASEKSDANGREHPRSSPHDDATALRITFDGPSL